MADHDVTAHSAEYARIVREVEKAREALNATRWWQFFKREEAAERYKAALWIGAMWELRNRPGEEGHG